MRERTAAISKDTLLTGALWIVCISVFTCWASGQNLIEPGPTINPNLTTGIELVRSEKEFSSVSIEPARMGQKAGIAVIFEGTDDLHYYAKAETAPAPGLELKIQAKSDDFVFGEVVFPKWHIFTDPLNKKIEVYEGNFTVFVPITKVNAPTETAVIDKGNVEIKISGIACTSKICLPPFEKILQMQIDWSQLSSWKNLSGVETDNGKPKTIKAPGYSIPFALALAFLAGLSLNIMPCVWPVLPLIVMRIVEQAKQNRAKSIAMGLTFCLGILLFFARRIARSRAL